MTCHSTVRNGLSKSQSTKAVPGEVACVDVVDSDVLPHIKRQALKRAVSGPFLFRYRLSIVVIGGVVNIGGCYPAQVTKHSFFLIRKSIVRSM